MRHALMYVLAAIITLNVLALVILQERLATQEAAQDRYVPRQDPPPNTVYTRPKPPVGVIVLPAPDCPDCYDIRRYLDELDDVINLTAVEDVRVRDLALAATDRLPALAFNATLAEYPTMTDGWERVGYTVESDGIWYVLPTLNAPYHNTTDGQVYGRVTATYIGMAACADCYNTSLLRVFLEQSRIVPHREIWIDAESPQGRALRSRYNITAVPTLLLSREADAYPNLRPGWNIVGTIEEDGTYVLRDLQRLRVVYYDLRTDRVMRP